MPRNSRRERLLQNSTRPRQFSGQPRSRTSSRGKPNGKSKPPIHGPGRRSSLSKESKVSRRSISSIRSAEFRNEPWATVIGFARRGADVKSTPSTFIGGPASRGGGRRTPRRSGLRARGQLGGGQVVDAPEAGHEARVARHDAPEGEIGQ